jgi:hypothetical protein
MTPITINPEQLLHYAPLNRNDIILHMALLSLAEEGKLRRNLSKMSRLLNKPRYRLLEAEFRLKRQRLLRVRYRPHESLMGPKLRRNHQFVRYSTNKSYGSGLI